MPWQAAGVLAILVIPLALYAVDPGRETPLHAVALPVYAGVGLVLLVLSFAQRPAVRPDRSLDEGAVDRRLAMGALLGGRGRRRLRHADLDAMPLT